MIVGGAISGMNEWQGKPKYLEGTCPNAALSTRDCTCSDRGSNLGNSNGKPATNRMSYGAANASILLYNYVTFQHFTQLSVKDSQFHFGISLMDTGAMTTPDYYGDQ
jgi:hypothetical protein